uniref:Uncharacterized protein n=1 Tax=Siphoviridae sp. ctdd214 TaxID=2825581 RepID=A0A8S5V619_9CAUD|nr:MAG TPA: hypothetical protein [Siphoviridae sp. ctdd214]
MKIYVNELYQIKAVRVNNTGLELKEIEVLDDFMAGHSDVFIKSYCYQEFIGENGEITGVSIYPYKDLALMESLEEVNSLQEKLREDTEKFMLEQEYRTSLVELQI